MFYFAIYHGYSETENHFPSSGKLITLHNLSSRNTSTVFQRRVPNQDQTFFWTLEYYLEDPVQSILESPTQSSPQYRLDMLCSQVFRSLRILRWLRTQEQASSDPLQTYTGKETCEMISWTETWECVQGQKRQRALMRVRELERREFSRFD